MIARIPFGTTGHESSRVLFGAAALAQVSQDVADKVLELLLQYGINHIDTAASYGDAELRIGPWMAEHRDNFFLATKTGERSYDAAYAEIQRSLERLQTNQVDLLQLHNLVDPEEWETAFGPDGALRAAKEAQAKGYVPSVATQITDRAWQPRHFRLSISRLYQCCSLTASSIPSRSIRADLWRCCRRRRGWRCRYRSIADAGATKPRAPAVRPLEDRRRTSMMPPWRMSPSANSF
ncbi:MAG: aldo/keto reductase [Ardenticatenales bacterium]|nr:aldo/keto reductase [Ardenticatenales bacterium]